MTDRMTHQECIDGLKDLEQNATDMPRGDDHAKVVKRISDIRDLLIKVDVQGQRSGRKNGLIDRMERIFVELDYNK